MNTLTCIVAIVLAISSLANGVPTSTSAPDQPLTATLSDVEEASVSFQVTGSATLDGSPVKGIHVNYSPASSKESAPAKQHRHTITDRISSGTFAQTITVNQLAAGHLYHFSFQAINQDDELGPNSSEYAVYTLPETPNIDVSHVDETKIQVKWSSGASAGNEDLYLISYAQTESPSCNVSLSVATCFGYQYNFDNLVPGTSYTFTIRSHNPSGYSKAAVIDYPV